MKCRALQALAFASTVLAGAAWAETPQPYQLVRALEQLQDDVIRGSADARTAQRTMLEQIGAQFLKVEPGMWASSRNAQAAVLFVLNGGSPTVVRKVVDVKALSDADRNLMLGALAYVGGREPQALALLGQVDPLKLGDVLGGNVALALGSLLIRSDAPRAIRMFALARLLLPGTLIEEAALRRQAFIHFDQSDLTAFSKISAQYLRRFGKSAYSDPFRERLNLAIKHLAQTDDATLVGKLDPLFVQTGDPFASDLLLLFAREALLHGRIVVARAAIGKLQDSAGLTEVEKLRLALYIGFSKIFTQEPEVARQTLADLGPKVTAPEDRWLVEAGARLLGEIVAWPPAVPTNPAEAGRESTGVQSDAAQALLASSDLLARADK